MFPQINRELDLRGFNEPIPVIKTHHAIDSLEDGDVLMVTTTDRGTLADLYAYCSQTGNILLQSMEDAGEFTFLIRKHKQLN